MGLQRVSVTPSFGDKMRLPGLLEMKRQGQPIVMVTAYDYPSARVAQAANVDIVLVGDSGGMTVLGYKSTVSVSVEEMLMLVCAARRGLQTPLLVADLPFGSYEQSNAQAIATAQRFVKEGGAEAVKLEGGVASGVRAKAIAEAGIPVMGHVGLTPQTATALGGYRVQGNTATSAARVAGDALRLQNAGCFAIVFEAIPAPLTQVLMEHMTVPIIGIGAGGATDGQVLVFHDLVGLSDGFRSRFAKQFADVRTPMVDAVATYAAEVRSRRFPDADRSYGMAEEELNEFNMLMDW